jgi:hypothetical protein
MKIYVVVFWVVILGYDVIGYQHSENHAAFTSYNVITQKTTT